MSDAPFFALSYSKVSSFQRCRKQYFLEYLSGEHKPPDPPSAAGIVGTAVHVAMRELCATDEPEVGRHELDVYLRMPAHEVCGPGTEWNRLALEIYETGVAAHASLAGTDRWAEKETYAPYRAGGVSVYAKVDRIDRLGALRWQVTDWKTGRSIDDYQTDAQLDLAHVALRTSLVSVVRRQATVRAVAWNLRTGEQRVRELERDDAGATLRKYAALARDMQETSDFPATPGRYCGFCRWRPGCSEAAAVEAGHEWDDFRYDPEDSEEVLPADTENIAAG